MRKLSLALRFVLALSVALVSVHTAIGRAEAAGSSTVEFCIGAQIVVLTVDANGDPVERHQSCPDCVLSGLAVLAGDAGPMRPATAVMAMDTPPGIGSVTTAALPRTAARGPPLRALA